MSASFHGASGRGQVRRQSRLATQGGKSGGFWIAGMGNRHRRLFGVATRGWKQGDLRLCPFLTLDVPGQRRGAPRRVPPRGCIRVSAGN